MSIYLNLRHSFYKKLSKFVFGKELSHVKDYWPLIKAHKMADGRHTIFYQGKHLLETHSFTDLNENNPDDIYIIGTGPSIQKQHLEKLSSKSCILLNGAGTLIKQYPINNILMYIIMDSTFVTNRFDIIKTLPKGISMMLSLGAIRAIAERDASILKNNRVYLAQSILEPYFHKRKSSHKLGGGVLVSAENPEIGFSLNPAQGFFDGGTVMSLAIQLASALNIENTYLLGLDIGNANDPRFYEDKGNRQKSGLLKDYQTKILPFMGLTRQVYHAQGKNIFNCSPTSLLPYDVVPFSDKFE